MDDDQEFTSKNLKRSPKTPESVDTDSDDSDDKQVPQKASKDSGFIDTGLDDEQPKKTSKTSIDEQEPAVKCVVMYKTENEQEPQKASKIQKLVDTDSDDEQVPSPAKIPRCCTHIFTKGVKKG